MKKYVFLLGTVFQSAYCGSSCKSCKGRGNGKSGNPSSKEDTGETKQSSKKNPYKDKSVKNVKVVSNPGSEEFFNECFEKYENKYDSLFAVDDNKSSIMLLYGYIADTYVATSVENIDLIDGIELAEKKFVAACSILSAFYNPIFWSNGKKDVPMGVHAFSTDRVFKLKKGKALFFSMKDGKMICTTIDDIDEAKCAAHSGNEGGYFFILSGQGMNSSVEACRYFSDKFYKGAGQEVPSNEKSKWSKVGE